MLYLFSSILLLVLVTLMPKSKEKLNVIKTIALELVIYFAYNTTVCYLFTLINIPITLESLAIVNIIIALIATYRIIKAKRLQSYQIRKRDILATVTMLLVVVITIAINFSGISRIRYISMDSFSHYKAAREFSENTTLFTKAVENTTTSKCFMPMGYVNVGILFKIARPYVGTILLYKLYIIFEAVSYFLVGILFYFCTQNKMKTKSSYGIGILFSIFYLIGYPLNALICGFHYLLLGILYIVAIFEVFTNELEEDKIEFVLTIILVTLLNIGIIFSYALFCPVIYLSEFLYFIKKYKQDKKRLIWFVLCSLVITGLMGCDISLFQRIKELGAVGIELDGWIYQNNFSNMILFVPFAVYYGIKEKPKKVFEKNILFLFILFFVVLFIGTKTKFCSNYYYYKCYYMLWFLMLYMSISGMLLLLNKNKITKNIVILFSVFYVFLFLLSIVFVETYIQLDIEVKQNRTNFMEVYTFNKTNMQMETPILSKEEIELYNKLEECLEHDWKNNPSILLIASTTQEKWLQSLSGYYHSMYPYIMNDIEKWNDGEYEYLLILEKRGIYEKINLEQTEIINQNESGTLYKRKSGE